MTRRELQSKYPNASESFLRANADPDPVGAIPHPIVKPTIRKSPEIEDESKERISVGPRLRVTITSYRCRLLDPDNLCPKFLIDALRYKHFIPDDSPEHIALEVRQRKVAHKAEEGTLVEICHA